jgi:hypothetical protein
MAKLYYQASKKKKKSAYLVRRSRLWGIAIIGWALAIGLLVLRVYG